MDFWERVKTDLQKGIKGGLAAVKEGATAVIDKTAELSDEGKKQYRLHELRSQVHKQFAELGGKVYALSAAKKNPLLDRSVKALLAKINKLELQITKLEAK